MEATKSNPVKLILLGIIASLFVLFYGATVGTKPMSHVRPHSVAKSEFVKIIYAGTPAHYRYSENALDGYIKPLGGPANINDLYQGDQNSNYSMVYLDMMSAYNAATLNNTCRGVLSMKKADISGSTYVDASQLKGGDQFGESPLFIKGMSGGWISFPVGPGMSKESLINLLK